MSRADHSCFDLAMAADQRLRFEANLENLRIHASSPRAARWGRAYRRARDATVRNGVPSCPGQSGLLSSLSAMRSIKECADAYMRGVDHPVSAAELKALRQFISAQFNLIRCPVVYIEQDITLPECIHCLQTEGILYISEANNSHPYLTPGENAQFRAVHDFHHIIIDADSSFAGECATFDHAASVAPKSIHWILFSEIVLQAAACIATGEFQPQKLVKVGA